jgi:hypothetical protein
MLENYKQNQDGIIEQISKEPFYYDNQYSESRYSIFSDRGNILNLRLGYIIGSLGKIPESLLDVGYGNGDFLINCKNFIKNLYGNDIEPAYPLPEGIDFISDITTKEVEVITFFDSLEHFHDIEFVKDLKCKYVIISLPWCYNGLDDKWFLNWKHRKPNEHLHHFNHISLEKFMNRNGFRMLNFCNLEDKIRIDNSLSPNILTACFIKKTK